MASRKSKLRHRHYMNQGGKCAYCDCKMVTITAKRGNLDPKTWTIEHIIPRIKGGKINIKNTIAICRECNEARNHRPLTLHEIRRVLKYLGFNGVGAVWFNIKDRFYNAIRIPIN